MIDMAATGTHLRRVAWVNANRLASPGFRLVCQEASESREAPGVQTTTRLSATLFRARADVRQVLHDDHGAGLDGIDDTPTEHMVAVAPEAVDLPGQLAQVPLSRAGAFCRRLTLE
nr:hypothetical protein [Pyrinomonas methylaliphatogenes]